MASISTDKRGNRRILFALGKGKGSRKKIHMGKAPMSTVTEVKRRVELLLTAYAYRHAPDPATATWAAEQDAHLYDKLAEFGLVPKRGKPEQTTLGAFIDGYLAKRTDIKLRTQINLREAQRNLVAYFGATKPLAEITEGDADEWRLWLANSELKEGEKVVKRRLGDNTVRRQCGRARQLFRAALKRRLIASNPFGEMKGIRVQANEERSYFISRDVAAKVLEACPDAQWKLLFALSRFGGLRCPSEHLALRWGDVNWELGRLTVRSPKTEHVEGKASRVVPIFAELKPYLDAVWDEADEDNPPEFIITRYRDPNSNLRTQLLRIIGKAGVSSWPKLFQNLRSTRQTELAEQFPAHVVCSWMGNSEAVAREHYLQVTDAHFEAAHFAAQTVANPTRPKATVSLPISGKCCTVASSLIPSQEGIPPRGRELEQSLSNETLCGADEGVNSGARYDDDNDLSFLVERWPVLSPAVKSRILALASGDEMLD